jgi:hypothetical protein
VGNVLSDGSLTAGLIQRVLQLLAGDYMAERHGEDVGTKLGSIGGILGRGSPENGG